MDIQHHFAVRYPDISQFPREVAEKLNVHGIHLKSQKPVQVGEAIGLQFRFPEREDPLLATAIVAWVSTQVDATGKRAIVAKQIEFDARAHDALDALGGMPEVHATPTPHPAAKAQPPLRPKPPVAQIAQQPEAESQTDSPKPQDRRKKRLIVGGIAAGLVLLLASWLLFLGGMRFIAIRFLSPPPALNVAYGGTGARGIEPPIPHTPAPKPIPPATALGFDYFQKPTSNEFIVSFSRAPDKIITSRVENPLVQTFYIENGRIDLDREQYFLPFNLVRTVTFEVVAGVLRIGFVAQNPHYLPVPSYDVRGRELVIRFVATD